MKVVQTCDILNPSVASVTDRERAMVLLEDLAIYLPSFTMDRVTAMKEEWDGFKALSVGVAPKADVLGFFKLHQRELPNLAAAVCDLAIIPSSSASCERVFSMLRCMFPAQSFSSLEDYRTAAVMLRYNKRAT